MLIRLRLQVGLILLVFPSALLAQAPAPRQGPAGGAAESRLDVFWRAAILSPGPYALDVASTIMDEMSNFPEEWTGGKGFGQRTLARVGSGLSSAAIGHGVAAVLKHRVSYEPCGCAGKWRRTWHALGRGFVTRTDAGTLAPHLSLFVAKAATAGIATTWYPSSYDGPDLTREAVFGVGANAGLNVAREFAPELKRLIGIR